ncbi:hypothetical protein DLAC_07118 [Tieghemostelium lacteum]|uniref:Dynein axonemal assembly factor 5 TPR repeats domain-containing protein n=1 Tax=Tieghemostelium lacteum TaxID=361077 RepID=A0A151ZED3_TIELA|nr:hypothetical protein DLAC_07118 [Tieghemostelium lacteum]|eukprot:KYQ92270.1 hypothetical protein DLAC_07118 [Tieghemostelium lacteum]
MESGELAISIENELKILVQPGSSSFSKRKSIERLQQTILNSSGTNRESVSEILLKPDNIDAYLLIISDSVEKCRTVSLEIYIEMSENLFLPKENNKNRDILVNKLIPLLENRMNQEDVDEVRFMLLQLLNKIISMTDGGILQKYADSTTAALRLSLMESTNNTANIREQACLSIQKLSEKIPSKIIYHSSVLVQPLLHNLTHKYQKVRSEALEALGSLVAVGSVKIVESLEPLMIQLANDNSQVFRVRLCQSIAKWIQYQPSARQYLDQHLMLVLLGLLGSDYQEVRMEASKTLNQISEIISKGTSDNRILNPYDPINQDIFTVLSNLPTLSIGLTIESRYLIFHHSQSVLKYYYKNFHVNEFEEKIREFKIDFLQSLLMTLRQTLIPYIDAIIEIISVREIDNYQVITKKVRDIVSQLSEFIDHQVFIPRLVAIVKRELSETNNPNVLQSLFRIMSLYYLNGFYSQDTSLINIKDVLYVSKVYLQHHHSFPVLKEYIEFFTNFYLNYSRFDIESEKLEIIKLLLVIIVQSNHFKSIDPQSLDKVSQLVCKSFNQENVDTLITSNQESLLTQLSKQKTNTQTNEIINYINNKLK